ncbi:MAG: 50S ribosomal protein L6 [Candidatus Hadarchaeales archaeon]
MEKIREEVELPEGVEAKLSGKTVEIFGRKGVLKRTFEFQGVEIKQEGRTIAIETASGRRRQRAAVGTIKSHLLNMIKGVTEGFRYKLRVVYAHFPITVKVEDGRVLIYNFLGERSPRVAKIVGGASVKVEGDEVIVEGIDKEEVGQTAFNIEQATYIKRRDPRVFQDGIYIVERA